MGRKPKLTHHQRQALVDIARTYKFSQSTISRLPVLQPPVSPGMKPIRRTNVEAMG
jgi:hypothetical protein